MPWQDLHIYKHRVTNAWQSSKKTVQMYITKYNKNNKLKI